MKKTNDLLLIVDMQNVYLPGNPWGCHKAIDASENIIKLLEADVAKQAIFTVFTAPEAPQGAWKDYNAECAAINEDSYLNQIMDSLQPYAEKYPVYEKSVYSSFSIEAICEAAKKADRVVITGVVAECCVLFTALSAIDAGCKVVYIKDGVSGFTAETEKETEHILSYLSPMHTEICTTNEYLSSCSKESDS